MAYTTGMLNTRVALMKRSSVADSFGAGGAVSWTEVSKAWANVTWSRGVKAMREGALDAYDVVMIRMRWRGDITRDWRIVHDGKTYEIESLHSSREKNEVQITAHEING